jgi:hypothetical protein
MAKSGSFEIKVFSTNREYLDEIAWKSDPTGNWEARAWTIAYDPAWRSYPPE